VDGRGRAPRARAIRRRARQGAAPFRLARPLALPPAPRRAHPSRAACRAQAPSVIFIDEIDSILGQRREGEAEGTIRVKNEVLVQMDGASADAGERLLLIGATNRPQELDDAARRRLQKRLMIPLPDASARSQMLANGLRNVAHSLSEARAEPRPAAAPPPARTHACPPGRPPPRAQLDMQQLLETTDGYSGSDMAGLCREAAMGPCRDPNFEAALLSGMSEGDVRPVTRADFDDALCQVRASVSPGDLKLFEDWNRQYGSFANQQAKRQALAAE